MNSLKSPTASDILNSILLIKYLYLLKLLVFNTLIYLRPVVNKLAFSDSSDC